MRHSWGKRSWWRAARSALGQGSTQTCARCGATKLVVRQAKLLPGRRRPRAKIVRLYHQSDSREESLVGFWTIVPPCPGPARG